MFSSFLCCWMPCKCVPPPPTTSLSFLSFLPSLAEFTLSATQLNRVMFPSCRLFVLLVHDTHTGLTCHLELISAPLCASSWRAAVSDRANQPSSLALLVRQPAPTAPSLTVNMYKSCQPAMLASSFVITLGCCERIRAPVVPLRLHRHPAPLAASLACLLPPHPSPSFISVLFVFLSRVLLAARFNKARASSLGSIQI
jgi:hypothetical protein